jgi:RNA polymerase sigma-70 factor (ECF subfamily)
VVAVILDRPSRVGAVDPAPDDSAALLSLARSGDARALEELLRASYDQVYPVCRRVLGNEPDAADAAQEAVISVVRNLHRFDGRSRFSTWLYRIAVNASIDELRRRSRRAVVAFPSLSVLDDPVAEPAAGGGPEDVAGRLDVEAALMELPIDFRAAVVLRDVCGLDYAEIGEILSIPGGTVRSRIARGRALVAQRLGPAWEQSS